MSPGLLTSCGELGRGSVALAGQQGPGCQAGRGCKLAGSAEFLLRTQSGSRTGTHINNWVLGIIYAM